MNTIFAHTLPLSQVIDLPCCQLLLALGSNVDGEINLNKACNELTKLGVCHFSNRFVNADYTASAINAKPDYTNQCVIVSLYSERVLSDIIYDMKVIESESNRVKQTDDIKEDLNFTIRLVSLDIDVLAVKSEKSDKWITIEKRYPFKEHEWAGIQPLLIFDE